MTLQIGDRAPEFNLYDQDRTQHSLSDTTGSKRLIVFMPAPFTSTCDSEMCTLRDNLGALASQGAELFVITTDTVATHKRCALDQGFDFPILSDFWPHGSTAIAYDCFNERFGIARRVTYALDEEGIITAVTVPETKGEGRNFDDYLAAVASG